MAGFATGSGRRVTVSESSLRRACQLVGEAEEEVADRQRLTASNSGGATELQFQSVRSHQQSAAASTFSGPPSTSNHSRPPLSTSTFRPPARTATRSSPPRPHSPPPSSSTDSDIGGLMLLPPHMSDTDDLAALAPNSKAATLLTYEDEPDSAVLCSLPSTGSSAFTSSPASTHTASSHPSPQPLPDSPQALPFDSFGGFVTGANVPVTVRPETLLQAQLLMDAAEDEQQHTYQQLDSDDLTSLGFVTGRGERAADVRPESVLRAQKLIADIQQQHDDEQQQQSNEPTMRGFVTGGGKQTAALRPSNLLRAQQLLSDDLDTGGQPQDGEDRGKASLMRLYNERPPLAALSSNTVHARNELHTDRSASSHKAEQQQVVARKMAHDDDKPLLTRRQVGKRLNEKTAIDLQRSPLADSPLPSPATVLLHVNPDKHAAIKRDAAVPSKKRKLTFNTPRTIAPGHERAQQRRKDQARLTASEHKLNLLAVRNKLQPIDNSSSRQLTNIAKGSFASLSQSSATQCHLRRPCRSLQMIVLHFSLTVAT